jgi:large subunit ribosomal protein L10
MGLKECGPTETDFDEISCFAPLPLALLSRGEEVSMDRQEKKEFVADLRSRLEKAQGTFIVEYRGINVEGMSRLRKELKKADAELRVVKNRLLKLASRDTETELIKEQMQGPTAIAVTYEDVVAPAKVLVDFAEDFKQLKIKGGQIAGRMLDMGAVKRLADMPSREVLLAQTLSAMQAVPTSMVRVLNGIIAKLLNALKAIEQEKAESA